MNRQGIALPMMLLLTLLLSISLGAGFLLAGSEHAVGADHDSELKAYAVAQEGIERYLTDVSSLPATLPDTRTISVPGGTATVTLRAVRTAGANNTAIYAITSVGQATTRGLRRSARDAVPERSISHFVVIQPAAMDLDAAFTSLSGMQKNGVSGTVSGVNECATGTPVVAGVAVPNTQFNQSGGNSNWIDGNPDNTPSYIGTGGTGGTAKDVVDIDWASILNGTLAPDFVVNRLVSPATGSIPSSAQFANWPVLMIKGNLNNGDNFDGKGVLIVTGNADFSNITWRGVVLIGGEADLSGSATKVHGAVVSGLNIKLGQSVNSAAVGNGNFLVRYNACDIASALMKFGGWRRLQNTWADNWPSYTVP